MNWTLGTQIHLIDDTTRRRVEVVKDNLNYQINPSGESIKITLCGMMMMMVKEVERTQINANLIL